MCQKKSQERLLLLRQRERPHAQQPHVLIASLAEQLYGRPLLPLRLLFLTQLHSLRATGEWGDPLAIEPPFDLVRQTRERGRRAEAWWKRRAEAARGHAGFGRFSPTGWG